MRSTLTFTDVARCLLVGLSVLEKIPSTNSALRTTKLASVICSWSDLVVDRCLTVELLSPQLALRMLCHDRCMGL